KEVHQNVQASGMFDGCVQKVLVNGRQLSLVDDVLSGVNIANCQHPCNGKPCLNGGLCEPLKHHYRCQCGANFIGPHCEQGSPIGSVSVRLTYHFDCVLQKAAHPPPIRCSMLLP